MVSIVVNRASKIWTVLSDSQRHIGLVISALESYLLDYEQKHILHELVLSSSDFFHSSAMVLVLLWGQLRGLTNTKYKGIYDVFMRMVKKLIHTSNYLIETTLGLDKNQELCRGDRQSVADSIRINMLMIMEED